MSHEKVLPVKSQKEFSSAKQIASHILRQFNSLKKFLFSYVITSRMACAHSKSFFSLTLQKELSYV